MGRRPAVPKKMAAVEAALARMREQQPPEREEPPKPPLALKGFKWDREKRRYFPGDGGGGVLKNERSEELSGPSVVRCVTAGLSCEWRREAERAIGRARCRVRRSAESGVRHATTAARRDGVVAVGGYGRVVKGNCELSYASPVSKVAFCSDGSLAVAELGQGRGGRVHVKGTRYELDFAVWTFAVRGRSVVIGGERKNCCLYDMDHGAAGRLRLGSDCLAVSFHDASTLAVGVRDGGVYLKDVRRGQSLLAHMTAAVDDLARVGAYAYLVADRAGALDLFDARFSGRPLARLRGHVPAPAVSSGFDVIHGAYCLAGGADGRVRCWRLADAALVADPKLLSSPSVGALLAAPEPCATHASSFPQSDTTSLFNSHIEVPFVARTSGTVLAFSADPTPRERAA